MHKEYVIFLVSVVAKIQYVLATSQLEYAKVIATCKEHI